MSSIVKIFKTLILYITGFILGALGGSQFYFSFLYQRPTHMSVDLMDFNAAMTGTFAMLFGGILGIVVILILRATLHMLSKR